MKAGDAVDLGTLRLASLQALAAPVQGLRVLLYGFSGRGFPGGDGVAEAVEILPRVGVHATYTHRLDPELSPKLSDSYDLAIVTNTRIGELLAAPARLWEAAGRRVLWFWDLRPGSVGAPLRGRVDHAFLSFNGPWTAPDGTLYAPEQWAEALGCRVGYCPQASPLRQPTPNHEDAPRVVFVGDLANATYHQGRAELCREIGATVVNQRSRERRLAVEAELPTLYSSARYCLSTSPRATGYTSVRTYSILACGGLLLLHRFPGCDRLFEDGRDALVFDTATAARSYMAAADREPGLRARIARSGRELHAANHTIAHRVLSIALEVLGESDGFAGWL